MSERTDTSADQVTEMFPNNDSLFVDMQTGKVTGFAYRNNTLECISGIFSYGQNDGLVWHGLVPCETGNKPKFASYKEALEAYNKSSR